MSCTDRHDVWAVLKLVRPVSRRCDRRNVRRASPVSACHCLIRIRLITFVPAMGQQPVSWYVFGNVCEGLMIRIMSDSYVQRVRATRAQL